MLEMSLWMKVRKRIDLSFAKMNVVACLLPGADLMDIVTFCSGAGLTFAILQNGYSSNGRI